MAKVMEQSRAKRTTAEHLLERVFADLPWGVIAFAAMAIGGLVWTLHDPASLSASDYLTAVGTGSGLLAIGHGIRTRDSGG